jgi:hypothetical protein
MSEQNKVISSVQDKQKQISLWTARVFTVLGLVAFGLSVYIVAIPQKGRFDLPDMIMMPVTLLMAIVSFISIRLIQRDRYNLGVGLLFVVVVLTPPILVSLLLKEVFLVFSMYLILLASFMINYDWSGIVESCVSGNHNYCQFLICSYDTRLHRFNLLRHSTCLAW